MVEHRRPIGCGPSPNRAESKPSRAILRLTTNFFFCVPVRRRHIEGRPDTQRLVSKTKTTHTTPWHTRLFFFFFLFFFFLSAGISRVSVTFTGSFSSFPLFSYGVPGLVLRERQGWSLYLTFTNITSHGRFHSSVGWWVGLYRVDSYSSA